MGSSKPHRLVYTPHRTRHSAAGLKNNGECGGCLGLFDGSSDECDLLLLLGWALLPPSDVIPLGQLRFNTGFNRVFSKSVSRYKVRQRRRNSSSHRVSRKCPSSRHYLPSPRCSRPSPWLPSLCTPSAVVQDGVSDLDFTGTSYADPFPAGDKTCVSGAVCTVVNTWYSQCLLVFFQMSPGCDLNYFQSWNWWWRKYLNY